MNNQDTIIVSGGATATFFDDVAHNGTEIRVSSGATAVYFGLVTGGGNFTGTGLDFFEGGYSPGSSPDLIDVAGDIGFGTGNTLTMELGGTARGTGYDALDVAGTASLDGLLDVVLFGGYVPSGGEIFDLIVANSVIGTFSSLLLPTIENIQWQVQYLFDVDGGTSDVVRLVATQVAPIPVPPAVWLFASALALLGWVRQRRQVA